jgi:hypothetical protein
MMSLAASIALALCCGNEKEPNLATIAFDAGATSHAVVATAAAYVDAWTTATADASLGTATPGQYFAGGTFAIIKSYLEFDTSPIASRVVTGATLTVTAQDDHSDADFFLQVVACNWDSPITVANRQAAWELARDTVPSATLCNTNVWPAPGDTVSVGIAPGLVNVAGGTTKLALVSANDQAAIAPGGNEWVVAEGLAGARPVLTVTFVDSGSQYVWHMGNAK